MNSQVFFLVAVVTALAFGLIDGHPAEPQKCCLPKQWSTYMTFLDTINSDKPVMLAMQMDYDRQMQVALNFTGFSKIPESQIWFDFNKNMIYAVQTSTPDYCYKAPWSSPMIQCIPDDAEYLGDSFVGPMGAGQLSYNGWKFRSTINNATVIITLATSKNGCVPIVEGLNFPDDPSLNQLYFMSNFESRLTNASLFDLPASCLK